MAENRLYVKVENKQAKLIEQTFELVCDNSDYEVVFDFDREWETHTIKTAIFVFGKTTVKRIFDGNICKGVAVEDTNLLYIGVTSDNIRTTTSAEVKCVKQSITSIADKIKDPSNLLYNELIELLNKFINITKGFPVGGLAGQVIKKISDSDFDYTWQDDVVGKEVPVITEIGQEYAISNSKSEISSKTDWEEVNANLSQRQRTCAYGNGYYVIAGANGEISYSLNGKNWDLLPSFSNSIITSMAFGKNKFIAIDSEGKIWISNETPLDWRNVEVKWENLPEDATQILEGVSYESGRFVIVGDNGLVAFSDDAEKWEEIRTPYEFRTIVGGEGKYVAAGVDGKVAVSYNGDDWSDYSDSEITNQYRASCYGNGIFVIGGANGLIRYSNDGINWNTANTDSTSVISYIRGLVYVYGKYYAVMYTSAGKGEIWVSSNAQNWFVQKETSNRLWCICEGEGIIFTSGDNGKTYILDLDVNWSEYEPNLSEGEYLWQRQYARLSDGTIIYGEAKYILHSSAILLEEKGKPNGVATLDNGGKVPALQLPSYVDDVAEYDSALKFPTVGERGKIYVDVANNLSYRWSGTKYIPIPNTPTLESLGIFATAEELNYAKGLLGNIQEQIDGLLSLNGGTMKGNINLGSNGFLEVTTQSGNVFEVLGLIGNILRVGGNYPSLELRGKNEKVTYNNSNLAFEKDVPSKTKTFKFTFEDNSTETVEVYVK